METAAERQQCSSCDTLARCWCVDCCEALCEACVSAHRRVTVTRSHQILNQPPEGNDSFSTAPTKFCRVHPSEALRLFCFTCSQFTCRDCQLMDHKSHSYQFVSEALDSLKKVLESQVQSLRAQRATLSQSLLDMETRLQDIGESQSTLKEQLMMSFKMICEQIKKRMQDIFQKIKVVSQAETEMIQSRMKKLKLLQQHQQFVTETAGKAQNTRDVLSLLQYSVQIQTHLKSLSGESLSHPETMSELKVISNQMSLQTILNFGELHVSWVPFSVNQTSKQNMKCHDSAAAATSSVVTLTCGEPSNSALLQTYSSVDSPVPPVPPVLKPSTSESSLGLCTIQSCAPLTTLTAVSSTQTVQVLSTPPINKLSHQGGQTLLDSRAQSTSVTADFVAPPAPNVLQVLGPKLVLNQSATLTQKPPTTVLLNNFAPVYRVLPVMPCTVLQQNTYASISKSPHLAVSSLSTPLTSTCLYSSTLLPQIRPAKKSDSAIREKLLLALLRTASSQLSLPPSSSSTNPPTSTSSHKPPPPNHMRSSKSSPIESCPPPTCSVTLPTSTSIEITSNTSPLAPDHLSTCQLTSDCPPSRENCTSSDTTSSHLKPAHTVEVVRAVADSACDGSMWQELAENELNSSEDSESLADDFIVVPSSPESPVTLELVTCSVCGSDHGSIVCSDCGRGYHRDCHLPPIGPNIWSEWTCTLCQDLSDPSDPYSSERPPQKSHSPGLSPHDQRRCERLLLHVKVEGCSHLSQLGSDWSRLESMSERLTVHRSYQTVAQFVSDVWSLFRDTSQGCHDSSVWDKLKESFRRILTETLNSDPQPSVVPSSSNTAETTSRPPCGDTVVQEQEVIRSKLTQLRKRLKDFLVDTSDPKRIKT